MLSFQLSVSDVSFIMRASFKRIRHIRYYQISTILSKFQDKSELVGNSHKLVWLCSLLMMWKGMEA
jgi:hypothetical protein